MRSLLLTVGLVAALASCAWGTSPERPADFGKRWVRSHPFTLMGLVLRGEGVADDKYVEAGFNTMLIWKGREGIFEGAVRMGLSWHFHLYKSALAGEVRGERLDEWADMGPSGMAKELERTRPDPMEGQKEPVKELRETYPGCGGFIVWDEPIRPEMKTAGKAVAWLKQTFPDVLVYSNAYPYGAIPGKYYGAVWIGPNTHKAPPVPFTYEDYLDDFAAIIRPDVLMIATYPYAEPPEGVAAEYLHHEYYKVLASARHAALKAGLPYWVFVQSYSSKGDTRRPSESDLRMQIYSSLAFGFTGIAYFVYDHGFDAGLLKGDEEQEPTPLYYHAKKLNGEVANLGQALRFLTNTAVRHVPGRFQEGGRVADAAVPMSNSEPRHPAGAKVDLDAINATPAGLTVYAQEEGIGRLRDLQVEGVGRDHNALIGFFRDDTDGEYFMIVNLRQAESADAEDLPLTVTVTLDGSVEQLGRLSRETGQPEMVSVREKTHMLERIYDGVKKTIPITHKTLTVTLPGGTGELFKLDDAEFPGLAPSEGSNQSGGFPVKASK